jgi:hypothetical protein
VNWLREQIAWLRDDPMTTLLCWAAYLLGTAAVVIAFYLWATGYEIR